MTSSQQNPKSCLTDVHYLWGTSYIGGIYEVAAMASIGVQNRMGLRLISAPTKDISAQA